MIDSERYNGLIKFTGFDDCIIGTIYDDGRFVYSCGEIVAKLMKRDEMDIDGAKEWVEYNMEPLRDADKGPVILYGIGE